MPWLGVLMFLLVGFILGGAFVAWFLTPTIRLVEADNARLQAEKDAILDAVATANQMRTERRAGGAA